MHSIIKIIFFSISVLIFSTQSFAADYYVLVDNQQQGPVTMEQLTQMENNGEVTKDTMVWKNGMNDWAKAGDQQDLQELFAVILPPPPPEAAPTAPPAPPAPPVAAAAPPAPASPAPPATVNYHVMINNQQQGPFSMGQLQQMTSSGSLTEDTMVWTNGMAGWEMAGTQQGLQNLFTGSTPPPSVQSVALNGNSITKNDASKVAKEAPPQPSSLEPGDDLEGMIAEYATNLQIFFEMQGAAYTVSYGVAPMNMTDKAIMGYINSMNLAYKDALLRAYVNMASAISPNGRDITTEDGVNLQDSQGDVILDDLKQSCTEEANLKYQQYLAKKERQRREKEGEENSLLGIIKKKLKSDGDAEVASSQPAEEKPEPDFIYQCTGDGNVYVQSSATTNSISDTLSGGRVWASMLHEGYIGVVLVKSNDTSEVASVLKNQMEPSAPLEGAFAEVAEKIKGEVANFPDIPLGLVGTRMMKLSNGEWALYSFGAAQVSSGGAEGFMDRAKKGAASSSATIASFAELSRFSGLMVDQSAVENAISSGQSKLTVEINVTQGTATYKTDTSSTLGKILNDSYSGSSNLKLIGAQQAYFKKFTDGPLSFYLSAQAWSPSIMAANLAKRKGYDSAAENAVRNGKYQVPSNKSSSEPNDTGSESRVIIMNQDW
jgi:hypothetical protein